MLGINLHAFTSLSLDQCGYVCDSFVFQILFPLYQ